MMKALVPSAILTLIVSATVGFFGSPRAVLNLQEASVAGYSIYWSWTLFFFAMALNGGLLLAMARGRQADAPEDMAERP